MAKRCAKLQTTLKSWRVSMALPVHRGKCWRGVLRDANIVVIRLEMRQFDPNRSYSARTMARTRSTLDGTAPTNCPCQTQM